MSSYAVGEGTVKSGIAYIVQRSRQLGLDPAAVLAVAAQEGLGGGVGDNGSSFGPFQLHQGGAYPASAPQTPAQAQRWAWSTSGLDYALEQISKVAQGLQGDAAISNIVSRFERPANVAAETAAAVGAYPTYQGIASTGGAGLPAQAAGSPGSGTTYASGGQIAQEQTSSPSSDCISHVHVLGISIPYPDIGCAVNAAVQPFVAVFDTVESFFSHIDEYLVRGGLILSGGLLLLLGLALAGRSQLPVGAAV